MNHSTSCIGFKNQGRRSVRSWVRGSNCSVWRSNGGGIVIFWEEYLPRTHPGSWGCQSMIPRAATNGFEMHPFLNRCSKIHSIVVGSLTSNLLGDLHYCWIKKDTTLDMQSRKSRLGNGVTKKDQRFV